MRIGYARTSPNEQNVLMQIRALKGAGAEKIFVDEGLPGNAVLRPAWADALGTLKAGDQLVIWSLDRIAWSGRELIDQLYRLGEAGVDFLSLRDRIDTTDEVSHLFYYFIGQFRHFEEQKVLERRIRAAAKKDPRKAIGRPPQISDAQWQEITRLMSADPPISPVQAAKLLGVSRQAIHSRLKREKRVGQ